MDKTFVDKFRRKKRKFSPHFMEEILRETATNLLEGKPVDQIGLSMLACCVLDACDAYREKKGVTASIHSEIAESLGLRRQTGRQSSDEYAEADLYQAIVDRMAKGEPDKKTQKQKTIGYKRAISKLIEEKHEALKIVPNTTPENIQRIYKKIDKMRKEFEGNSNA